jgi:hypothetical protein
MKQQAHHDVHADSWGNLSLAGDGGDLHAGADPHALGPIAGAMIDCVLTVASIMIEAWMRYTYAYDVKLESLRFLAYEIRLTGSNYAWSRLPDLSVLGEPEESE